ncbi:class I SAM-dependent methyltransferase [Clostridium omnivorum]|uniref:Methyltransferase type 11 domain-containing protein n=1 Tax=Clostridium omnivorum TaxID=1604902 RepID=A0ABQ5N1H9_9CLOT|nr:class I SAM-dependent methyltransferase [Clostridium sp. E14]GLC29070.1 hypothetical protein bsdE14_04800 [Clostridium sp. E14]
MDQQKDIWNKIYDGVLNKMPTYDLWLDKYEKELMKSKDIPIIDLGCGSGNDTLYLIERGYEVISCDFSEEALEKLSHYTNNLNIKCFDFKDGLPFENNSTQVIISDLSLHYFTWNETQSILREINRVLMKEGLFLCRVNSTNDENYGAGEGLSIEENYYNIEGKLKRFFNEKQLRELFKEWKIEYINENEINRYKKVKIAWEIAVKKLNK